ncbi:MAG: hypothetical protein DDT33_01645 [Firmicutes bacterium]|nr:hypothetical protein [Bacillota bacterium]
MEIGLYHRKCNVGRLQKPFGLRIDYFEDDHQPSILFSRSDIREVPGLAEGLTLQDQIAAVLRHGAMTITEIASEISANPGSVKTKLYQYKNRFVMADPEGKKWGLLSNYSDE